MSNELWPSLWDKRYMAPRFSVLKVNETIIQKNLLIVKFPNYKEKRALSAGFEPTRGDPIGFQVQRLNHSAKTADRPILNFYS